MLKGEVTLTLRDSKTLEVISEQTQTNTVTFNLLNTFTKIRDNGSQVFSTTFEINGGYYWDNTSYSRICISSIKINPESPLYLKTENFLTKGNSFIQIPTLKTDLSIRYYEMTERFNTPSSNRTINTVYLTSYGTFESPKFIGAYVSLSNSCIQTTTNVLDIRYRLFLDTGNIVLNDPKFFATDSYIDDMLQSYFDGHWYVLTDTQLSWNGMVSDIDNYKKYYFIYRNEETSSSTSITNIVKNGLVYKHRYNISLTKDQRIGEIQRLMSFGRSYAHTSTTAFNKMARAWTVIGNPINNNPVQLVHYHNKFSDKPFVDVDFLSNGFGVVDPICTDDMKLIDKWPLFYRIETTKAGLVGESRYFYRKRHTSGFSGNTYDVENQNMVYSRNIKNYSLTTNLNNGRVIYIRSLFETGKYEEYNDGVSIIFFTDFEVLLQNQVNGNLKIFKSNTVENFNPSGIKQVVADDIGNIYVASYNSLYRIQNPYADNIVLTHYNSTNHNIPPLGENNTPPCYGVCEGYNGKIFALFQTGLMYSTDYGDTWTLDTNFRIEDLETDIEQVQYIVCDIDSPTTRLALVVYNTTATNKLCWYDETKVNTNPIPSNYDLYSKYVSLLITGKGTSGDTNIKDNTYWNYSITNYNSTAISNIQSQFYGTSLYFNGTNNYLEIIGGEFALLNLNFTLECYVYPITAGLLFGVWGSGTGYRSWGFYIYLNRYYFYYSDNGSNSYGIDTGISVTYNQFSHVAFTREGNIFRFFLNGVLRYTSSSITTSFLDYNRLTIGCAKTTSASEFFKGYINDLRITKGFCRYTSTFTPPTQLESSIYLNLSSYAYIFNNVYKSLNCSRKKGVWAISKKYVGIDNNIYYKISKIYFNLNKEIDMQSNQYNFSNTYFGSYQISRPLFFYDYYKNPYFVLNFTIQFNFTHQFAASILIKDCFKFNHILTSLLNSPMSDYGTVYTNLYFVFEKKFYFGGFITYFSNVRQPAQICFPFNLKATSTIINNLPSYEAALSYQYSPLEEATWQRYSWNSNQNKWQMQYFAEIYDLVNNIKGIRHNFDVESYFFTGRSSIDLSEIFSENHINSTPISLLFTIIPQDKLDNNIVTNTYTTPRKQDHWSTLFAIGNKNKFIELVWSDRTNFYLVLTNNLISQNINISGVFPNNTTYRLGIIISNTDIFIYKDGELLFQTSLSLDNLINSNSKLFLGGRCFHVNENEVIDFEHYFYRGEIKNFQVWNSILTLEEIQEDFVDITSVIENDTNLICRYEFNDSELIGKETKLTSNTYEVLDEDDAISVKFYNAQEETDLSFVKDDYYTFGVIKDGILKDNALAYNFKTYLYRYPVDFNLSEFTNHDGTNYILDQPLQITERLEFGYINSSNWFRSMPGTIVQIDNPGAYIGAIAMQRITTNGYFEFVLGNSNLTGYCGIGTNSESNPTNTNITYHFYFTANTYTIRNNSTTLVSAQPCDYGKRFRIEKTGTTIRFYTYDSNNLIQLLHTISNITDGVFYPQMSFYTTVPSSFVDMIINWERPAYVLRAGNVLTETGAYDDKFIALETEDVSQHYKIYLDGQPAEINLLNSLVRWNGIPVPNPNQVIITDSGYLVFNPSDVGKAVTGKVHAIYFNK